MEMASVASEAVRCTRCHRTLRDPKSRARHYGPVCWQMVSDTNETATPADKPREQQPVE